MNMHAPQSYEAATELEEIAAIPHNIVTPRHARPLIGVFQDSVVGTYRLTRPGVQFSRREFMNLMMRNKRFDGTLPAPALPNGKYTGQQVLSQLLPPLNMEMGNAGYDKEKDSKDSHKYIKIVQGQIQQGQVDSDIYMKPGKGIVHITYNDYGPAETTMLLDSIQRVVEDFLVLDGFSVGISDLVADEGTLKVIQDTIRQRKKELEEIQTLVHSDLFENNTGKTNQQEFEDQAFSVLNSATADAGKSVKNSLTTENRLVAMVASGSKGGEINIAQMIACLGQQSIEGKRLPNGLTDRTLPHYKKYDDGAEARGFIESSFIRGLTPQEFFFHAMTGREGLIDTAVKSVTGDTPVVVMEHGKPKHVMIGDWIDAQLEASPGQVEHFTERRMELLHLEEPCFIPTTDEKGVVTWGAITAITRHDPGTELYEIKTQGGKRVIVTESKALLIWNEESSTFERMATPDVKPGHFVPVTMRLSVPPTIVHHIDVADYLPKKEYLYGSDFLKAQVAVDVAMGDSYHIPQGWWDTNNGTTFTLPYDSKARFTRAIGRSNTESIEEGYVYPWTTNRACAKFPDQFALNKENGIFLGLFLAEGNVDRKSGYIQITNNNPTIRQFVKTWFEKHSIKYTENSKTNHIGGTSSDVRGFSTVLGSFLTALVGHGAGNKYVPVEAVAAPEEFIVGLLNGYFSGDGTVSDNSVEAGSASPRLIDGISMIATRMGLFGKVFQTTLESNNLGTETIQTTHRISFRGQWATQFAKNIELLDEPKQQKLNAMNASERHRNFTEQNDVVLDKIVEINVIGVERYPKVYDLTVPSTLNFGLANGLHVVDTADTGYIQRQLVKALEDIVVQHDGTVRDANMNILQFHYGEDSIMATKLEVQELPLDKLSRKGIRETFSMSKVDWTAVLEEGVQRPADEAALTAAYVEDILEDQRLLVEGVFRNSTYGAPINGSVPLARLILNTKVRFGLKPTSKTNLTPGYVLTLIKSIVERTKSSHVRMWAALLRYHLAPHTLIVKERFTKEAFDTMCEMIVVAHMKSWVQPGEQVGIVAAMSIGEPSTQLTLNSVDWDERIVIEKDGQVWTPPIGEFIDAYAASCDPKRVQHLENNQVYISLKDDGHTWRSLSCDGHGKMQWTTLEAITKHPVVNEDGTDTILEVELESGRTVKATKGKSFLTVSKEDGLLTATNGSDLHVGDELPCALSLATDSLSIVTSLPLRPLLPPTEWLYGSEMRKAMATMDAENARGNRHWFQANQGRAFTVPYSRSDSFRDAFTKGKNPHDVREGYVYPKYMRSEVPSQIPEVLPLDAAFGFFCGAYLAEGMSNRTQVCITNNDTGYLAKIRTYMDSLLVGTHLVDEERHATTTDIMGHTTSLIIHSTLLAKVMGTVFGSKSYVKDIPDWVLQAPDEFVKALVDGYISGDGCVHLDGSIVYSSVSERLITKMNAIMARYGIFTSMSSRMPPLGKFKSVSRSYISYIGPHHTTRFAELFPLTLAKKQERLMAHLYGGDHTMKRTVMGDVVLDKVKTIKEVRPLKGFVYDLTVEGTRNFVLLNTVNCADTFHLSGVASKSNVTQGIPRLREILKVTKNPKATSLTIYMKPEYRQNKEKARELVQDLELTLLRTITNKVAIYWDPTDEATVVEEDRQLLAFYRDMEGPTPKIQQKWLLRLELNREEMYNKNISMADVVFVIQQLYPTDVGIIYSDYNADKLVLRIRMISEDDREKDTAAQLDDFTILKRFQNKLLNQCVIRGVPGIKAVTFRNDVQSVALEGEEEQYKPLKQYILDTDGTNYVKVMNHPSVDATKLYTTNVYDILDILGLEAARAILLNELQPIFGSVGVNIRHMGILCDWITRTGRLMSIDRNGINKNDIGPLAKMSFEETSKIVLKAALFGEVDPVTGVSANIMTGQPFRGGTAFSQILLDDTVFEQFTNDMEVVPEEEGEVDGNIFDLMEQTTNDPCAKTYFQTAITMPDQSIGLEEPDVELYES